jgi:hypothetical protein
MSRDEGRAPGGAASRAVRWTAIAILLAGLARAIAQRGPMRFTPPQTVFSNTPDPVPGLFSDAYLGFLAELSGAVPEGAAVVVLTPDASPMSLAYFVALFELPRQRLATAASLAGDSPPRFVGVFRREFRDERYERRRELPGGALWELR